VFELFAKEGQGKSYSHKLFYFWVNQILNTKVGEKGGGEIVY
jgi:hypothetical protein